MTTPAPGDIVDVTIRAAKVVLDGYYGFICIEKAGWINPDDPGVTVTPHANGEADGDYTWANLTDAEKETIRKALHAAAREMIEKYRFYGGDAWQLLQKLTGEESTAPDVTVTPHTDGGAEGLDVDAIRARAATATPGPWGTRPIDDGGAFLVRNPQVSGTGLVEFDRPADAQFIAHARTDIPALLAALDRLHAPAPKHTIIPRCGDCGEAEGGCYDCANDRTRHRLGMSPTECAQHPAGIEAAIEAGLDAAGKHMLTAGYSIADVVTVAIRAAAPHLDAGRAEAEGVEYVGTPRHLDGPCEHSGHKFAGPCASCYYQREISGKNRFLEDALAAERRRVADLEAERHELRRLLQQRRVRVLLLEKELAEARMRAELVEARSVRADGEEVK